MKTARERAEEACNRLGIPWSKGYAQELLDVAEMFKEHARDQRHLAAERVRDRLRTTYAGHVVNEHALANKAHGFAVNAPAPGE